MSVLRSQKLAFDTNALQSRAGAIFHFGEARLACIPSTKIMFVLAVR